MSVKKWLKLNNFAFILIVRFSLCTVCSAMKNMSLHISLQVEDSVQLLGLAGESNMNYDLFLHGY